MGEHGGGEEDFERLREISAHKRKILYIGRVILRRLTTNGFQMMIQQRKLQEKKL